MQGVELEHEQRETINWDGLTPNCVRCEHEGFNPIRKAEWIVTYVCKRNCWADWKREFCDPCAHADESALHRCCTRCFDPNAGWKILERL